MRLSGIVAVGVVFLLASPGSAGADPIGAQKETMRIYGPAQPPYGFVSFCERMPQECAPGRPLKQTFDVSSERLEQLKAVNRAVNREIVPVTDLDLYGVADHWTMPTDRGDCEDYVLLKRKRLIALGWPPNLLLITVVRDERGDGHAVLTVRTPKGDLILDNKTDEIKYWYQVPYQFVMRQSHLNPRHWWSLDSDRENPAMALAGVRKGR